MIGQPIDCTPTVAGKPWKVGMYVCEIYSGWKLLEWHDGQWYFPERTALWQAGDPVQWVGPLPERRGLAESKIRVRRHSAPSLEFDL